MNKTWLCFLSILTLYFFSAPIIASAPDTEQKAFARKKLDITYFDTVLTLKNISKQPLNLKNAVLQFYKEGSIETIRSGDAHYLKLAIDSQQFDHLPHHAGNVFKVNLQKIEPAILQPDQTLKLKLITQKIQTPEALNIDLANLAVVPVKVEVMPAGWVQTIKICNNTPNPIPLTNVSFNFNFTGNINGIWGSPWVDWKVATRKGNNYTLTGGTAWTPPLASDPNCNTPLTIQFSSDPNQAIPSGPFVFNSEGAQPPGGGSINVTLPQAPASGAANPTVTIQGSGFNQEQTVTWGQQWKVDHVTPGSYTISASRIETDGSFYEAKPITVTVADNITAQAAVSYAAVATSQVAVTLVDAPGSVSINFAGTKYTVTKNLGQNGSIALPADTYTVSASTPGYTAKVTPNPLVVPTNTALSLTFERTNLSARFGAYFQSWSSRWSNSPEQSDLAKLPSYVNYVYLSFAKPDAVYRKGSMDYMSVGLQFNYESGNFLKQAIAALHQKHPNTKVILAVGGATYNNWDALNPRALADFVADFGIDGIDIDYEAAHPGCMKGQDNLIHCAIDQKYQSIVQALRAAFPRPYLLCSTAWSISAYGQDQWSNAGPQGDFTGMMLPFLRSPAAKDIDYLNVMSYDASDAYNPHEALAAFNHYYPGPVYMGVEVPPEAWGGHVYTLAKVNSLTQATVAAATQKNTSPGMMLWSLQKAPNGTPSPTNPSAQMMSTAICVGLGLNNCNDLLFP